MISRFRSLASSRCVHSLEYNLLLVKPDVTNFKMPKYTVYSFIIHTPMPCRSERISISTTKPSKINVYPYNTSMSSTSSLIAFLIHHEMIASLKKEPDRKLKIMVYFGILYFITYETTSTWNVIKICKSVWVFTTPFAASSMLKV